MHFFDHFFSDKQNSGNTSSVNFYLAVCIAIKKILSKIKSGKIAFNLIDNLFFFIFKPNTEYTHEKNCSLNNCNSGSN